jgi:hypothetical protein
MNGFKKYLAATFLSAAMLFTMGAQAMEIRRFDKMADQDQADYIGDLIVGAEKVLTDEGRPAMFATLDKNHIPLPDSFYTVASNFKPKLPLQANQNKDRKN